MFLFVWTGCALEMGEVVEVRFFFFFSYGFLSFAGCFIIPRLLFHGGVLYSFGKTLHGYWGPFRKQDEGKGMGRSFCSVPFISSMEGGVEGMDGWMDGWTEKGVQRMDGIAHLSVLSHTALLFFLILETTRLFLFTF